MGDRQSVDNSRCPLEGALNYDNGIKAPSLLQASTLTYIYTRIYVNIYLVVYLSSVCDPLTALYGEILDLSYEVNKICVKKKPDKCKYKWPVLKIFFC